MRRVGEARQVGEEAVAILLQVDGGGEDLAWVLERLGDIAVQAGDADAARRHYGETLQVLQPAGPVDEESVERVGALLAGLDGATPLLPPSR